MHLGLLTSLILHGVLLGWALLAIVTTPPLVLNKPDPVEVAIISADDLVRLKQGDREAKNLDAEGKEGPAKEPPKKETPKPTPPPPPVAASPPPPPPEPPKPDPPKPDPIAEAIKQAAVEPPPKPPDPPKIEPPKVEPPKPDPIGDLAAAAAAEPPPPKPEPPKKEPPKPPPPKPPPVKPATPASPKTPPKQDLASLVSDALKTTPDKSAEATPPKALVSRAPPKAASAAGSKSATPTAVKGPAAGAPEGTDKVLTADKLSMLNVLMKNNVRRCWNINAGLEGANKLIVKTAFKLTQDGRLIGAVEILNPGNGPQFEDAANSARRALIDCQPYTNLPPELYSGGWDYMALQFDPGKMF